MAKASYVIIVVKLGLLRLQVPFLPIWLGTKNMLSGGIVSRDMRNHLVAGIVFLVAATPAYADADTDYAVGAIYGMCGSFDPWGDSDLRSAIFSAMNSVGTSRFGAAPFGDYGMTQKQWSLVQTDLIVELEKEPTKIGYEQAKTCLKPYISAIDELMKTL